MGFCDGLCFIMNYFVSFLFLQSSWRGRELLAFIVFPWVGLQCVIVAFPDHLHLLFDGGQYLEKMQHRINCTANSAELI